MTGNKVSSLGEFCDYVHDVRENVWRLDDEKGLWFRGESQDHERTLLRPELYRARPTSALRPVDDLLDLESELYEEFQRCADQFRSETLDPDFWQWDSYFLLQHHGGATRLLDWSDGALMALHFAVRNPQEDENQSDAFVYILEPDRLDQRLDTLHEEMGIKEKWREYIKEQQPGEGLVEEDWEDAYLPSDEDERKEFPIPSSPLVIDIPHITRRVAAQRSRFVVFGTDFEFLSTEFKREKPFIKRICINGKYRRAIRRELRDSGVTESVIYPDLDGLGREMKQLWEERK
jgi:FRG domain